MAEESLQQDLPRPRACAVRGKVVRLRPMTPARKKWLTRAALVVVFGVCLTPVASFTLLSASGSGLYRFPGSTLRHSLGVVARSEAYWSAEVVRNAYFTDVSACPFSTVDAAETHTARSGGFLLEILKDPEVASAHTLEHPLALPAWETATHEAVPPNTDPLPKSRNSATNRAFGFPLCFAASTMTEVSTPGRPRYVSQKHIIRLGQIHLPSRLIWPGVVVDVLFWGVLSLGVGLGVRGAWRRLRRSFAATPG